MACFEPHELTDIQSLPMPTEQIRQAQMKGGEFFFRKFSDLDEMSMIIRGKPNITFQPSRSDRGIFSFDVYSDGKFLCRQESYYGEPGAIWVVREECMEKDGVVYYAADTDYFSHQTRKKAGNDRWLRSILAPLKYSRYVIEITSVELVPSMPIPRDIGQQECLISLDDQETHWIDYSITSNKIKWYSDARRSFRTYMEVRMGNHGNMIWKKYPYFWKVGWKLKRLSDDVRNHYAPMGIQGLEDDNLIEVFTDAKLKKQIAASKKWEPAAKMKSKK